MIAYIDMSLAIKFTAQINLFGGSIFCLGTQRHQNILQHVDDLSIIGSFALTELGFGNNNMEMQTTATYDPKTQEFIIHNPTTLSQKYWMANGALHASYAVVFAQLFMPTTPEGKEYKNEGIHIFLVRLRNEDMSLRKGIFIEDLGYKLGVNGIDNAKIAFNQVHIPREAILNRYSDVDEKGTFKSSIPKMRERFLRVADSLLGGRLCIGGVFMSITKIVLTIGLRYASKRLVVGEDGKSSSPILDFQLFQNAVYPLLCKTICINIAYNKIKEIYSQDISTTNMEVVRFCCFIKTLITWNSRELSSVLVERMGGQGYLAINRVCEGITGSHGAITGEGDNSILMQKVAKLYIVDLQSGKLSPPKLTRCPKREIPNLDDITSIDVILNLLKWREISLAQELAKNTNEGMKNGKSIYKVWMREENDVVQDLALSYAERQVFEFCVNDIKANAKNTIQSVLNITLALFGIYLIKKDLAWFLTSGSVNAKAAQHLQAAYKDLIKKVHTFSMDMVNSFGIPEYLLGAPVAQDYVEFNKLSWTNDNLTSTSQKPKL